MTFLLSRPEPVMRYPSVRLITYTVIKPIYSGVPVRISWTELYLDLLRWERGFSSFRRKNEAKRFLKSFSALPQMRPPCPRWRVVEISNMIGLHVPLWRNSPGEISPRIISHELCTYFWCVLFSLSKYRPLILVLNCYIHVGQGFYVIYIW